VHQAKKRAADSHHSAARTLYLFQGATIALYSTETLFGPVFGGGAAPALGVAFAMASADIQASTRVPPQAD
jgi:hypothetical protein